MSKRAFARIAKRFPRVLAFLRTSELTAAPPKLVIASETGNDAAGWEDLQPECISFEEYQRRCAARYKPSV